MSPCLFYLSESSCSVSSLYFRSCGLGNTQRRSKLWNLFNFLFSNDIRTRVVVFPRRGDRLSCCFTGYHSLSCNCTGQHYIVQNSVSVCLRFRGQYQKVVRASLILSIRLQCYQGCIYTILSAQQGSMAPYLGNPPIFNHSY